MVDKVLESKEEVESVEQSLRSSNSPTGTAREPTTEQQKVSLERRRREEKMERGELQDEMPAHTHKPSLPPTDAANPQATCRAFSSALAVSLPRCFSVMKMISEVVK